MRRAGVPLLPIGLVTGGLMAAALAVVVRRRRSQQQLGYDDEGRSEARLPEEQRRVELAAEIGADHGGAAFVDPGLRYMTAGIRGAGSEPPEIVGAELHPAGLVVLLAEACDERPAGFVEGDDPLSWVLPRPHDMAGLEAAVAGVVAPLPFMVSVGRSGDIEVLVNPEEVGVVAFEGDDEAAGAAARQVVAAMAVELATASRSGARLFLVGFGHGDGLGDAGAVTVVASAEECVGETAAVSAAGFRILDGQAGDVGPVVVLCLDPPSPTASSRRWPTTRCQGWRWSWQAIRAGRRHPNRCSRSTATATSTSGRSAGSSTPTRCHPKSSTPSRPASGRPPPRRSMSSTPTCPDLGLPCRGL